jgi:anaphase-promoting complex subunit 2
MWKNFELLGLLDRYENVIASIGYEFIEQYMWETCKGRWDKPILEDLRVWMSNTVVPWTRMLQVYARGPIVRSLLFTNSVPIPL